MHASLALIILAALALAAALTLGFQVLPIAAAIVVAFALWFGRRGLLPGGRSPQPRHLVVRIVCGVLGVIILVAIGVGTSQEVRRCYASEEPPKPLTLRVPTLPPPDLPTPPQGGREVEVKEARLLASFLAVEVGAGEPRSVGAWQIDIRLPRDKGRLLTLGTVVGRSNVSSQVQVSALNARPPGAPPREPSGASFDDIRAYRAKAAPAPTLVAVYGSTCFICSGPGLQMNRGRGGLPLDEVWCVEGPGSYTYLSAQPPLSIVHGPEHQLIFVARACRVAEGDPLREVPVAEFVRQHEAEVRQACDDQLLACFHHRHPRKPEDDNPFRGFALALHIEASSLLLLVAAILLSQLFARRSLAFAGVLAAVVLYVAALDRAALGSHLSRLADPQASVATRMVASWQARDTFFYRATAVRAYEKVAADSEAPAAVRELAAAGARWLSGVRQD